MLDEAAFTAGDLMMRDVAVVRPEASLLDAVKLMAQRRVSGMLSGSTETLLLR